MVFYQLEIGRFDRRLRPEEEMFERGEMTSGGGSSGGNRGSSAGPMSHFLSEDHNRIDELLTRAIGADNQIDAEVYDGFRRALLRHIGMEEKIVLPAVERRQGAPLPVAAQLRLEHGAIASLLVLIPTPQIVSVIRRVLKQHNAREEGSDGVYSAAERVLQSSAVEVLAQLRAAAEIPLKRCLTTPRVVAATRRTLTRAGFDATLPD
jgi:hypothetical protein